VGEVAPAIVYLMAALNVTCWFTVDVLFVDKDVTVVVVGARPTTWDIGPAPPLKFKLPGVGV
jgi:hypothetical protein